MYYWRYLSYHGLIANVMFRIPTTSCLPIMCSNTFHSVQQYLCCQTWIWGNTWSNASVSFYIYSINCTNTLFMYLISCFVTLTLWLFPPSDQRWCYTIFITFCGWNDIFCRCRGCKILKSLPFGAGVLLQGIFVQRLHGQGYLSPLTDNPLCPLQCIFCRNLIRNKEFLSLPVFW